MFWLSAYVFNCLSRRFRPCRCEVAVMAETLKKGWLTYDYYLERCRYVNADLLASLQKRAEDYESFKLENDKVTEQDVDEVLFPQHACDGSTLVPVYLKLRNSTRRYKSVESQLRQTGTYDVAYSPEKAVAVIAEAVKTAQDPASCFFGRSNPVVGLTAQQWKRKIGLETSADMKQKRSRQ